MNVVHLPRQTGKTRILVDHAEDALRAGESVLVIVPNEREAESVRRLIRRRFETPCASCGHAKTPELPAKLVVSPLPHFAPQSYDRVLIDNLDVVLARLIGQPVDLATVNRGPG